MAQLKSNESVTKPNTIKLFNTAQTYSAEQHNTIQHNTSEQLTDTVASTAAATVLLLRGKIDLKLLLSLLLRFFRLTRVKGKCATILKREVKLVVLNNDGIIIIRKNEEKG